MHEEGQERHPGETADAFARRLAQETPEVTPPATLTDLLEQAHYGPDEPGKDDLERMRECVRNELSRQSLRRQSPMEPFEPAE